ncbi:MAG: hypothetical protein Q4B91_03580 [Atopobiaceae bacterium]|nr:hypothetical protein [Atopobiaceae bacterium]
MAETDFDGGMRPVEITWVDGRRFPVVSCCTPRSYGRWDYGNLVLRWEVELVGHAWRSLYWERGQWFVHARHRDRNGERAPREPVDT